VNVSAGIASRLHAFLFPQKTSLSNSGHSYPKADLLNDLRHILLFGKSQLRSVGDEFRRRRRVNTLLRPALALLGAELGENRARILRLVGRADQESGGRSCARARPDRTACARSRAPWPRRARAWRRLIPRRCRRRGRLVKHPVPRRITKWAVHPSPKARIRGPFSPIMALDSIGNSPDGTGLGAQGMSPGSHSGRGIGLSRVCQWTTTSSKPSPSGA
jgi:hypothetical protein